jgi:Fe2+ or Zn2+ uptake regulation protein
VLEALFEADGPVSAEYLSTRLGLEPASVYRNLETLEAHGVVQHVHLGHGLGLHALTQPGPTVPRSCALTVHEEALIDCRQSCRWSCMIRPRAGFSRRRLSRCWSAR